MKCGALHDILYCKRSALLNAVNALVLRSMVSEKSSDILHTGNEKDIQDKDHDSQHAFDNGDHGSISYKLAKILRQQVRKHHEKSDGKGKGSQGCEHHEEGILVASGYLLQPLVQLGSLSVILLIEG